MSAPILTVDVNPGRFDGEPADPMACLMLMLATKTLDPMFEGYGNFIEDHERAGPGVKCFWGNFHDRSFVFRINTNDPAVIDTLTKAIRENQAKPSYALAKEEYTKAEDLRALHQLAAERERETRRMDTARRVLGIPVVGQ